MKSKINSSMEHLFLKLNASKRILDNEKEGFLLNLTNDKNDKTAHKKIGIGATSIGLIIYCLQGEEENAEKMAQYIVSQQLNDGSWSLSKLKQYDLSLAYATCYATKSLLLYNRSKMSPNIQQQIEKAISWVLQNQNEDGGWGIYNGGESMIHPTSEVLHLFSHLYPEDTLYISIKDAKIKAEKWLFTKMNSDGSWNDENTPSPYHTAMAYRGLVLSNKDNVSSLGNTKKWLYSNFNSSSNEIIQTYYISIKKSDETITIDETLRCYPKAAILSALSCDISIDCCNNYEKMIGSCLKLQSKSGCWCDSQNETPIFLNYNIYFSLYNALKYDKPSYTEKFKELFYLNKAIFLAISILSTLGFFAFILTFILLLPSNISVKDIESFIDNPIIKLMGTISGIATLVSFTMGIRTFLKNKNF